MSSSHISQQWVQTIREKFAANKGIWSRIPEALFINNGAVFANMTPYTPEQLLESMDYLNSDNYVTSCNKLKADGGCGD